MVIKADKPKRLIKVSVHLCDHTRNRSISLKVLPDDLVQLVLSHFGHLLDEQVGFLCDRISCIPIFEYLDCDGAITEFHSVRVFNTVLGFFYGGELDVAVAEGVSILICS